MIEVLRVVTSRQIALLTNLAAEIWREHYPSIISEAQVEYMLEKFQSYAAIVQQIDSSKLTYYLLYLQGEPSGYFAVQIKADQVFLSKLYVRKISRNQGGAAAALDFVRQIARANALDRIVLTINKNNHASLQAYEKLGFVKTGEQVTHIGNGYVMDDFVMVLQLA